jgi:hypothetical protein
VINNFNHGQVRQKRSPPRAQIADFNPVYQPVLNTSAQPIRGEIRAGIPNEWINGDIFTIGVLEDAFRG